MAEGIGTAMAERLARLSEATGEALPKETQEAISTAAPAASGGQQRQEERQPAPAAGGQPKAAEAAPAAEGGLPPWLASLQAQKPAEAPRQEAIPVPEEVARFVKDAFGSDDVNAFITQYKSDADRLNGLKEVEQKLEQVEQEIQGLDPVLQLAIGKARKGEDWLTAVKTMPRLDWNKPADKQDPKTLIDAYYGDRKLFSEQDYVDIENGDADEATMAKFQTFADLGKERFTNERDKKVAENNAQLTAIAEGRKQLTASVEQAMRFAESLSPEAKARIPKNFDKQLMPDKTGIPPIIRNVFFDEKGVWRPDAVIRLFLAEDGMAFFAGQAAGIERKTKEDTELKMMGRMPETPGKQLSTGAGGKQEKLAGRAQGLLEQLGGWEKPRTDV